MDACVVKCMFLGYPKGVKGYHLWCLEPRFKKCIIRLKVVFNKIEMAHKPKVSKCEFGSSHDTEKANIEVEFGKEKASSSLHDDAYYDLVNDKQEAFNEDR